MMLWILIAVILGGLRIAGVKHLAFQAAAHLYLGWLIGVWWYGDKRLALWLAIALSILEVACFFSVK
jgi:hypothetical protein